MSTDVGGRSGFACGYAVTGFVSDQGSKTKPGGADGDRTHDLSIANAALSQLSYGTTRGGYYIDLERVARALAAEPRRGGRFLAWGVSPGETGQTQ